MKGYTYIGHCSVYVHFTFLNQRNIFYLSASTVSVLLLHSEEFVRVVVLSTFYQFI